MDDKIRDKIQKLFKMSQDESLDEAHRQNLLDKADELMIRYKIDRALLNQAEQAKKTGVVKKQWAYPEGQFMYDLDNIMLAIINHCDLKYVRGGQHMTVVGFEADAFYAEILWLTVQQDFVTKLFPRWDTSRSLGANIKAYKDAGTPWPEIWAIALNHHPEKSAMSGAWVKTVYRRECQRLGIDWTRQSQRHGAYRVSFAQSFCSRIRKRLDLLKVKQNDIVNESSDNLPALMREEDILNHEFWDMFPHQHPDARKARRDAWLKRVQKQEADEAARRARMSQSERDAEDAQKQRQRRQYESKLPPPMPHDEAGWAAGHQAANEVDLTAGGNRVNSGNTRELET